jgi:L-lactate dehydrogenase (cytochrome)
MIKRCPITPEDHRQQARRRLPRFLADYIEGGAGQERTLRANDQAWAEWCLRQRVLVDVDHIDTTATLAGKACAMPLALAPIGLAGMSARRGEVQAVQAADHANIPFTLSTVGVCSIAEVAAAARAPFWFQLYMLRDRGIVEALLEQAWAAGCQTLIFTIDLPMPGSRHRDVRNGIGQPGWKPQCLKAMDLLSRPRWLWDVAVRGKPLSLGSMTDHVASAVDPSAFQRWVDQQFDASVTWADIAWLRDLWPGQLILKGLLDEVDARAAVEANADGLIVSNHGGRQLDSVAGTATRLPDIVQAVEGQVPVWVDGGVRSGIDVFKALALGAQGALIGRPWVWALASGGEPALRALLDVFQQELRIAMALTGTTRLADIGPHCLDTEMRKP